jgi:ATP-dependent Lon protease
MSDPRLLIPPLRALRYAHGKPYLTAMPFRLPIFPLSVALFPGNPLPLHIFEPRYRRMLADCLAGDRRFGITPQSDNSDPPEPGAVGCIAEVRVNQELPDGRSNIMVVGGSRFRISHLLDTPEPYLVAMVQTFEDEAGTQPSTEEIESLRGLALQYLTGLRELNDETPEELVLPEDALTLSFHVAGNIACDLGIKQDLLAERSTARRVRALLLLLPVLTSAIENGITVHRQAHSNGRGGRMPDPLSSS